MAIRLITYDLNKETTSEDYKSILEYIKKFPWARLSESSYAVETEKTPTIIYKDLKEFLDENDHLLILTLNRPYYGIHSEVVINWLDDKL